MAPSVSEEKIIRIYVFKIIIGTIIVNNNINKLIYAKILI